MAPTEINARFAFELSGPAHANEFRIIDRYTGRSVGQMWETTYGGTWSYLLDNGAGRYGGYGALLTNLRRRLHVNAKV